MLIVSFTDCLVLVGTDSPKTTDDEEELDLLYDSQIQCYYDPKSCTYYELSWSWGVSFNNKVHTSKSYLVAVLQIAEFMIIVDDVWGSTNHSRERLCVGEGSVKI